MSPEPDGFWRCGWNGCLMGMLDSLTLNLNSNTKKSNVLETYLSVLFYAILLLFLGYVMQNLRSRTVMLVQQEMFLKEPWTRLLLLRMIKKLTHFFSLLQTLKQVVMRPTVLNVYINLHFATIMFLRESSIAD
ncbi:hypothetical protein TSUD_224150 [Trifolium subterraneum]|uniref:Uncharacterized protein n=1 Tax=Trifolium subterraneum TaxID=3900 RepID=A0A2Z6M186_TRISU|nr:hypothetical protein TSUD_224150 [Trifolium subterraneum]